MIGTPGAATENMTVVRHGQHFRMVSLRHRGRTGIVGKPPPLTLQQLRLLWPLPQPLARVRPHLPFHQTPRHHMSLL